MYFAHSIENSDQASWQALLPHLEAVAAGAAARAAKFGGDRLAMLAGLLHDLGKYTPEFQAYIDGRGDSPDHSTAGAFEVLQIASRPDGIALQLAAYCIAGHHAGLPDRSGGSSSLSARIRKPFHKPDPIWKNQIRLAADQLSPKTFKPHADDHSVRSFQLAMLGRMIFSCLVDADFIDTEKFYAAAKGENVDREWPTLQSRLGAMRARFDSLIAQKQSGSTTALNAVRADILAHARGKAALPRGVFTLDVPTGGGKTLTSLGFALDHAAFHAMDRIIYCAPFTAIIDQTAKVFQAALGEHVLEHHSSFEGDRKDDPELEGERSVQSKLRRAMENWDAPVVVTTNVQLLESLFAHRTSRCRKLHNIVNSVIILDEAQIIPLALLRPCVVALDELARNYGCTIVLCTATQPALTAPRFKSGFKLDAGRELAPDPPRLHRDFKRVTLRIRPDETTDDDLVAELADVDQALVIVNTRNHALALYLAAKAAGLSGLVHLTTRQVAADRRDILESVRTDLHKGRACRVIATSLVEAGVDLDFPRVWRAQAGLDQIVQAAGRCNREGTRPAADSFVTVFHPAEVKPPAEIKGYADAMGRVMKKHQELFSPEAIKDYFEEVYWQTGDERLDRITIAKAGEPSTHRSVLSSFLIGKAGDTDFAYRTVGENFRLIESGLAPVIVAIDDAPKKTLAGLRGGWLKPGSAARDLQSYIVQVPPGVRRKLLDNGHVVFVEGFDEEFVMLKTESFYSREIGLAWERGGELGQEDSII